MIDWIQFTFQKSGLLHLLFAEFCLEANVRKPVALLKSHNRKIFKLAVVKLSK